jgi:hypothetical protein
MNGVRKVTPPDEELKIIVFSPFVLHYINEVLHGFSLLEASKGLLLVRGAPDFPPVEFLLTHFPRVDSDFSLTNLRGTCLPFTPSPVFTGTRLPLVCSSFSIKKNKK